MAPPPPPRATLDYLASLQWIWAAENLCLVGPAGTGKSPWGSKTQFGRLPHAAMLFLVSLAVRALARLVVGSRRDDRSKDLEIVVLRHQLRVLRRKNPHVRLRPLDRTLLAAASRVLPRGRWASFMATPATLLRWHRELVTPAGLSLTLTGT